MVPLLEMSFFCLTTNASIEKSKTQKKSWDVPNWFKVSQQLRECQWALNFSGSCAWERWKKYSKYDLTSRNFKNKIKKNIIFSTNISEDNAEPNARPLSSTALLMPSSWRRATGIGNRAEKSLPLPPVSLALGKRRKDRRREQAEYYTYYIHYIYPLPATENPKAAPHSQEAVWDQTTSVPHQWGVRRALLWLLFKIPFPFTN